MRHFFHRYLPLYFALLVLLLICSCGSNPHSINHASIDSLIVGKWQMVEYGSGCVNALDAISFYENGKMDYPFETGEFTYRFITSDSLAIYNHGFGEQLLQDTQTIQRQPYNEDKATKDLC